MKHLSCLIACVLTLMLSGVLAQSLENPCLKLDFDIPAGTFSVLDKRCNVIWRQEVPRNNAATGTENWIIPAVDNAIVIDGSLDDWGAAKRLRLTHDMTAEAKQVDSDQDCSADVMIARSADNTAIFLAVSVTDDAMIFDTDANGLWHTDSVEFWLGTRNFGFYLQNGKPHCVCWANHLLSSACQAQFKLLPHGYVLEARINLHNMADITAALNNGQRFLTAVGVNDADDRSGRQGNIYAPRSYVHRNIETYAAGMARDLTQEPAPQEHNGFTGIAVTEQTAQKLTVSGVWRPYPGLSFPMKVTCDMHPTLPEFTVNIILPPNVSPGNMLYPRPMTGDGDDAVVLLPQDEGIMLKCSDKGASQRWLGNPTMPWIGVTHLRQGHGFMAIAETAEDMRLTNAKAFGRQGAAIEWLHSMGEFSYPRRIHYVFANQGRYVALAKRYRRYIQELGYFKTLQQKELENPNFKYLRQPLVDIYGEFGTGFIDQLAADGIKAILHTSSPDVIRRANDCGFLSTVYDIYTDLHEPASPRAKWERNLYYDHDYDTIKEKDGSHALGWDHHFGPDGKILFVSHVACTSRQLWNLGKKLPQRLENKPYRGRFLDCTTACRLYECFDPNHRMTRTQDRDFRNEQFKLLWQFGQVPGSERGRWWAIPWIGYLEGIQSTGNFSNTDISGWPIDRKANATPLYRHTAFSPAYRLPLFSLVFHECAITTWWWGDHSHRIPEIWYLKDLIQILYGSTPQWFLTHNNRDFFYANYPRFVQGFNNVSRWQGAVVDAEMTNHEHLSDDLALQRSTFSNGLAVTANLGNTPKTLPDGRVLPAYHYLLTGTMHPSIPLPLNELCDPGVNWKPDYDRPPMNLDFDTRGTAGWQPAAGMNLSLETSDVHDGKCALRITGNQTSGPAYNVAIGPKTDMTAGETWTFSAWMNIKAISKLGTNPCLKVCLTANGKYVTNIFTSYYDTSKLGTWQHLTRHFTVPAGKNIDAGYLAVEKQGAIPLEVDLIIDSIIFKKE